MCFRISHDMSLPLPCCLPPLIAFPATVCFSRLLVHPYGFQVPLSRDVNWHFSFPQQYEFTLNLCYSVLFSMRHTWTQILHLLYLLLATVFSMFSTYVWLRYKFECLLSIFPLLNINFTKALLVLDYIHLWIPHCFQEFLACIFKYDFDYWVNEKKIK